MQSNYFLRIIKNYNSTWESSINYQGNYFYTTIGEIGEIVVRYLLNCVKVCDWLSQILTQFYFLNSKFSNFDLRKEFFYKKITLFKLLFDSFKKRIVTIEKSNKLFSRLWGKLLPKKINELENVSSVCTSSTLQQFLQDT